MSKKLGYVTFIAVLLVLLSIGCISATDAVDTDSLSVSDSSSDMMADTVSDTSSDTVSDTGSDCEDTRIDLNDDGTVMGDSSSSSVSNEDPQKNTTEIKGSDAKITTKSDGKFTVTLVDNVSNLKLKGQIITFTVNGKSFNRTTDTNGMASLNINFKPGKYPITYCFAGNDYFDSSSGKATINVVKMNTKITASNMVMVYSNKTKYLLRLLDAKNNPLAGKTVSVKINGVIYKLTTNANGYAARTINLPVGAYNVLIQYAGDSYYNGASKSTKITVNKITTKISAADFRQNYGDNHYYTVRLYSNLANKLANSKISFIINGKTYVKTTNNNGRTSLKINLKPNNYTIKIKFSGNANYAAKTVTKNIVVYNNKTKLALAKANNTFLKGESFGVYLKDKNNKPIADKKVKITIDGKTYTRTTNAKGLVNLALGVNQGSYNVVVKHINTTNSLMSSSLSCKINVIKNVTYFTANNKKVITGTQNNFGIKLLNVWQKPMAGENVTFTLNGVSTVRTTNENGYAYLPYQLSTGTYNITYSYTNKIADLCNKGTKTISVYDNKTYIYGSNMEMLVNSSKVYSVTLKNQFGDVLPNKIVTFTINGREYNVTTNSKGVASRSFILPSVRNYTLSYSFAGDEEYPSVGGQSKLLVYKDPTSFSIDNIVEASRTIAAYYKANGTLPTKVTILNKNVTMAEYLYYASRAITNIREGKLSEIDIVKGLAEPGNPAGDTIKTNITLSGYVDSANRTYRWILENKQGPNFSTTTVGKIPYECLVDTFSRVLVSYGDNQKLPSSILVDTGDSGGKPIASSIKKLAHSLTDGLTSDYNKAKVLFNWVRDNVAYRYYSNSLQGAEKTLKLRSGNCCDQSNLYVALCRTIGLTVRYVHGYCYFPLDGTWYGHVWVEVKLNGKWYSADCVSVRNSFGTIVNWNTKTATIYNRYTNLPF